MPQPQETATPEPEQPAVADSAPAAGDTDAGATAEQTQAGGQPTEAAQPQTDGEEVPEGYDSESWAKLPKAEKKRLNQYFTQRTQRISAREKEIEQVAAALNAAVQQQQQAAPPPAPAEDALALQQIEQAFGPEAAAAFDKLTQARVTSVRAELERERAVTQAGKLEAEWNGFLRDNPDAKELEPVMVQVAQTFRPNGMPMREYFETLHLLAQKKSGRLEASLTKKITERIQASARAVENPSSGVTPSKVTPVPPDYSKVSLREAVRDAAERTKRGE